MRVLFKELLKLRFRRLLAIEKCFEQLDLVLDPIKIAIHRKYRIPTLESPIVEPRIEGPLCHGWLLPESGPDYVASMFIPHQKAEIVQLREHPLSVVHHD